MLLDAVCIMSCHSDIMIASSGTLPIYGIWI